jgi:hypothetical protein
MSVFHQLSDGKIGSGPGSGPPWVLSAASITGNAVKAANAANTPRE